ncbi:MAG TPA: hypothetical protein DER07_09695 [Armatimonadetes bacterium]|jgi:hypothetical protein|nr:hypothetical protein [Armatimonadota bacterium]MCA1996317.1 hypothetical protein [Armatimonadota bacterium]HCE01301.1 hypothetical protein [Armatimonadota bacterium]
MVYCSCGKPIEKIPSWMQRVNVEFVCNNCPNRKHQNITQLDLTAVLPATPNLNEPQDLPEIDEELEAE